MKKTTFNYANLDLLQSEETLIVAPNPEKKIPIAGYGRCRACDCKGYVSKHNDSHECKNCDHHYDRHESV